MEFDAGDYLKIKDNLEETMRVSKMNEMINEVVLEYVKRKLKGFEKK